jgi:hypothetical protein
MQEWDKEADLKHVIELPREGEIDDLNWVGVFIQNLFNVLVHKKCDAYLR